MENAGEHHLHKRKRSRSMLRVRGFKLFVDHVMSVVAFCVPVALVPQVYKVYTFKDVEDLSIETWALLAFFNLLWTIYGILHKTPPIIVSSVLTGLLQLSLVAAILMYG